MASKEKIFYKNPNIEFLFGFMGGAAIPTKQDKYKPIQMIRVEDDGKETVLDDFYIKKPDKDAVIEFHKSIQEQATKVFENNLIIKRPDEVEVILSISITESRYKEVDVDNLAKTVLDGLKGIAFDDDSQVSSLICSKHIHPMRVNGIFIGINRLTQKNKGLGGSIMLFSESPWD
jgi:Holliday junction resolvase RusA-like endonuclease